MTSLIEQVRLAQVAQGLSVQQLLDKSGLRIERSVLYRKLNGSTPATTAECEALSLALGLTLVYPSLEPLAEPETKRKARKTKRVAA